MELTASIGLVKSPPDFATVITFSIFGVVSPKMGITTTLLPAFELVVESESHVASMDTRMAR